MRKQKSAVRKQMETQIAAFQSGFAFPVILYHTRPERTIYPTSEEHTDPADMTRAQIQRKQVSYGAVRAELEKYPGSIRFSRFKARAIRKKFSIGMKVAVIDGVPHRVSIYPDGETMRLLRRKERDDRKKQTMRRQRQLRNLARGRSIQAANRVKVDLLSPHTRDEQLAVFDRHLIRLSKEERQASKQIIMAVERRLK